MKTLKLLFVASMFLLVNTYVDAKQAEPDGIITVKWSPDGTMIAGVGEDGFVGVFDAQNADLIHTYLGATGDVFDVDWNSSSSQIVATSADTIIRVWDVDSGNIVATFTESEYYPYSISWSADDSLIASIDASPDGGGILLIWDIENLEQLYNHNVGTSGTVEWDANTNQIAISNYFGGVVIFDPKIIIQAGQLFTDYSFGTGNPAMDIAWSPDYTHLAIAEVPNVSYEVNPDLDFDIAIWNISGEEILRIPSVHNSQIISLAWSSTNQILSTSYDGEIKIWDAVTGEILDTISTNNTNDFDFFTADWSPDGTQIAYGEGDTIVIYSLNLD